MNKPTYRPDPDGFKVPWQRYGKLSQEILKAKYNRLHNHSIGLHVRLSLNHG